MVAESPCALNTGICQRADFLTVKSAPFFPVELLVESGDEFGMDEVNKGVSDIASIIIVDREIEEIEFDFEIAVEFFKQKILGVLGCTCWGCF